MIKYFFFLIFSIHAAEVGQDLELTRALYGPSAAELLTQIKNIQVTLPAKTKGKILNTKNFNSGNKGLFIEIQSDVHKGEKYWVQYNTQKPLLQISPEGPPALGKSTIHSEPVLGYRDPSEVAKLALSEASQTHVRCDTCDLEMIATSGQIKETNSQFANSTGLRCVGSKASAILETCRTSSLLDSQQKPVEQFKIRGTNGRLWRFHFRDQAAQDLGITVEDGYAGFEVMLFPRRTIPQAQVDGSDLKVVLPTGEVSRYDGKTGQIKSGPMTEANGKISYSGSGVMVQVRGIDESSGTYLAKSSQAVISKKGHNDCIVSPDELWPGRKKDDSSNHFRFAKDSDFNSWLKSKCGFTI